MAQAWRKISKRQPAPRREKKPSTAPALRQSFSFFFFYMTYSKMCIWHQDLVHTYPPQNNACDWLLIFYFLFFQCRVYSTRTISWPTNSMKQCEKHWELLLHKACSQVGGYQDPQHLLSTWSTCRYSREPLGPTCPLPDLSHSTCQDECKQHTLGTERESKRASKRECHGHTVG